MAAFDIFEGEIDHDPVQIACSEGMENAKSAMERIAKQRPGRYFIWESSTEQVLAMIDTTPKRKADD